MGTSARLKAANPALRVVLTGCSVREPTTRPACGAATRRSTCSCGPTRSPSSSTGSAWRRRQAPIGAVGATTSASADRRRRRRPPAGDARRGRRGAGRVARGVGDQRLAADHLRLRQDLHLLHRAVQPRPGAQPPVRRDRRRGARARRGRLPRGHAARPERQLVRPRPAARAALRRRPRRALELGRRLDLDGRPDLAALLRAIDGIRTADGVPAIPRLRFVTSHPWDLSDRLIAAMAECAVGLRAPAPAGPVGRRRRAAPDGPPVHDRALPRAAGAAPRGRARASRSRPT